MWYITYNNDTERKRGECMDYAVEYYEQEDGTRPAEEFILAQDKKMQAKYFWLLNFWKRKALRFVSLIQNHWVMVFLKYVLNRERT